MFTMEEVRKVHTPEQQITRGRQCSLKAFNRAQTRNCQTFFLPLYQRIGRWKIFKTGFRSDRGNYGPERHISRTCKMVENCRTNLNQKRWVKHSVLGRSLKAKREFIRIDLLSDGGNSPSNMGDLGWYSGIRFSKSFSRTLLTKGS